MFLAFAVRFYLYSIIRNPVWVLPVEMFNGITYALAYSAAISHAGDLAPDGAKGTLQGIVGMSLSGIGMQHLIVYNKNILYFYTIKTHFVLGSPIGCFVGGYLFNQFGSITSFKFLSIFVLAVCFAQTIVNQLINRFSKKNNVKGEMSN